MTVRGPLACVIGDMDLIRPLAIAGIACAAPARAGPLLRRSRFVATTFACADPDTAPARFVSDLAAFAVVQDEPPVLFYQGDWDLLAISRHRDRLAPVARFVAANPELVEDLTDKARFAALAERLELPVPRGIRADPAALAPSDVDVPFPLIVKPLVRHTASWNRVSGGGKAIAADSAASLEALWPSLREIGGEVLLQAVVPGPESRIESYHVYVDESGAVAGEFTGRKLRTHPTHYGHSSAVEITGSRDVRDLGRDLVARLRLRGVAKLDFKRTPEDDLRLLEVNPRFSLWHHPGAIAGVNIPALVYADLTGRPRPAAREARAGVRWCHPGLDNQARKAQGIPLMRWLAFVARTPARSRLALDDPLPALAGLRQLRD